MIPTNIIKDVGYIAEVLSQSNLTDREMRVARLLVGVLTQIQEEESRTIRRDEKTFNLLRELGPARNEREQRLYDDLMDRAVLIERTEDGEEKTEASNSGSGNSRA